MLIYSPSLNFFTPVLLDELFEDYIFFSSISHQNKRRMSRSEEDRSGLPLLNEEIKCPVMSLNCGES